jgi:adenylate cyclase
LSKLITTINQQQPRAIGLDLYRDLPVAPGTNELAAILHSTPNLVGIEKVIGEAVQPSPILKQKNQVAFVDLIKDRDGKVRRGLLSIELNHDLLQFGLANRLALMYLAPEAIEPQPIQNTQKIALGKGEIVPFQKNDGGYIDADDGGFQILINYRGNEHNFQQISITDVLNRQIPPDLMRDRIVLVGSIAPSLNDFFATPYSDSRHNQHQDLPGVFIHANIASQLISEALDGRSSIKTTRELNEWIWIFAWTCSVAGISVALLKSKFRPQLLFFNSTTIVIFTASFALLSSSYLLFLGGLWLPVASSLFSVVFSTIIINGYYKQATAKQQQKLAFTDSLTEIPNRRCFDDFLNQQWQKNSPQSLGLSIILGDVDYFKKYNDTYGHQAGDFCLQ